MIISYIKTILNLNPNAKCNYTVSFDENMNKIENIDSIVWEEGTTPIDKQTILNKQIELQTIEDNRIAQQEANKQSALNKLKALGLNDAEIKAIIGV
jgi:hypothetical protein